MMTIAGCTNEQSIALANFPVPVRISTTKIEGFYYDKCDGADDLSFSDESGNILPHEVEVWNTAGESVAWVSVPQVYTNAVFYMNWGHDTKLETVQSQEVWTVANYLGAWHMNTPYNSADETHYQINSAGGVNLTMVGNNPTIVANGKIGTKLNNVYTKTSVGEILTFPSISENGINKSGFVLSGWAYWQGYKRDGAAYLLNVGTTSTGSYDWACWVRYNNPCSKFGNDSPTRFTNYNVYSAWFHWAVVVSGKTNFKYYINGVLQQSVTKSSTYVEEAAGLSYETGGTAGQTDELRIRNVASSADWIKAEYDSVNNKNFLIASKAVKNSGGFIIVVQ